MSNSGHRPSVSASIAQSDAKSTPRIQSVTELSTPFQAAKGPKMSKTARNLGSPDDPPKFLLKIGSTPRFRSILNPENRRDSTCRILSRRGGADVVRASMGIPVRVCGFVLASSNNVTSNGVGTNPFLVHCNILSSKRDDRRFCGRPC